MSVDAPKTPRSYSVLAFVLLAGALVLLVASWREYPFATTPELLVAIAGAALSEVFSFELAGLSLSLAYPLVMGVIVLAGPAAAGLAVAFTAIPIEDIRRRRPVSILAFNLGQLVLSACVGGWVYVLLHGRHWNCIGLERGDQQLYLHHHRLGRRLHRLGVPVCRKRQPRGL